MVCGLSCGFAGRGSKRLFDRGAPMLTVTDPCIWHGCGTNLSRRKPATMAGAPTDQARVCLAVPPRALATLLSLCRLLNLTRLSNGRFSRLRIKGSSARVQQ